MLARKSSVFHSPIAIAAFCMLVALLAPWCFSSGLALTLLSQMGIAIIACLSFNLLLGQGGMLSFGHALYSGVGAYAAMHLLNRHGAQGLWVALVLPLVSGVVAWCVAMALGYLCTRKAGTSFAMITLGMAELVAASSLMFPGFFGGEAGLSGNRAVGGTLWGVSLGPAKQLYYVIAAYTLLSGVALYAFTQTPLGRMLNAVRDNPERVEFLGYNAHTVRYLSFGISGLFAGVAGALGALNFELVTTEVLGPARSGAYLLFTVLGGTAFFFGPVLGGILMVLCFVMLSSLTKAWLLYVGMAFVVVVVFAPGGLAGVLAGLGQKSTWQAARRQWPWFVLLAFLAVLAFFGLAVLLELVYHQQLDSTIGPELRWMALDLSTQRPRDWVLAASAFSLGTTLALWSARRARGGPRG
jgi:branched-chain amino acid transport system permease protein